MQSRGRAETTKVLTLPAWVPDGVRHYLVHTEAGLPIRAVARSVQVHASTILRQVRRVESRREDPLVDGALRRLSDCVIRPAMPERGATSAMSIQICTAPSGTPEDHRLRREAQRVLRRLCETGAVLAVARDMDRAVVVREGSDGETSRTAVLDQEIAQAMAVQDWIATADPAARIARYRITSAGRAALKELIASAERARGLGEAPSAFDGAGEVEAVRMAAPLAESPLIALARRRDKTGAPFLSRALVAAGERLREDFELAQMGGGIPDDWQQMPDTEDCAAGAHSEGSRPDAARKRVLAALSDLGPGLGDIALRCCCYLEGLEVTEQRMGWSARSGKIVLRIALQRLRRHYDALGEGPRLG